MMALDLGAHRSVHPNHLDFVVKAADSVRLAGKRIANKIKGAWRPISITALSMCNLYRSPPTRKPFASRAKWRKSKKRFCRNFFEITVELRNLDKLGRLVRHMGISWETTRLPINN
jgi:hypothetical protein